MWVRFGIVRNSCLIGVRSEAQRGPRRNLYPFLSPPEPLWHHRCFWCVLWLFEADFGICSWETNGYLPSGKISIPRIGLLFDGILSGAANHPQSPLCLTPPLVPPLLRGPFLSLSHPSLSERFTKRADWLTTSLYHSIHLTTAVESELTNGKVYRVYCICVCPWTFSFFFTYLFFNLGKYEELCGTV